MSNLFLTVIKMSVSASIVCLAVLLLRLVLKRAPRWITVLLWGIVALRLVCPVMPQSAVSLVPRAETVIPAAVSEVLASETAFPSGETSAVSPDAEVGDKVPVPAVTVLSYVWLAGVAVMLVYAAVSCIRVRRRVGTAVRLRDNLYASENVASPFVFGIARPRIYVPFGLSDTDTAHVAAHETAHIRRGDCFWKPLGFLLLSLHWFNPLVWLGYVLLCRDIEAACDEKVVSAYGDAERADYSQALLTCSKGRRTIAACPLAFGETSVKGRVKSVLNYKKPTLWIIIAAVLAIAAVAVCFLTNRPAKPEPGVTETQTQTEPAETTVTDAPVNTDALEWATYSVPYYYDVVELPADIVNTEKLQISSARHLPVCIFSSPAELEKFAGSIGGKEGWDATPGFDEEYEKYDDAFFRENVLAAIYVHSGNCTHRFGLYNAAIADGECLFRVVETTKAEAVDWACAGWLVTVEVPRSLLEGVAEFDAVLDDDLPADRFEATPESDVSAALERGEYVIYRTHYKEGDVWMCNGHSYKYRFEISGRIPSAAANTTYIVLSNVEDITFDMCWKASGFSSNTEDYFDARETVIVGERMWN